MRVGDDGRGDGIGRNPLLRAGRALRELPLVAEERVEVAVVPLDGVRGPRALETACCRVHALAGAEAILPAESHLFDRGALGLRTHERGVARAVHLAERVAAGDERDGLFVVHRHAAERLANVARARHRIGLAVRAFRIHIDETHLHRGERILELAVAGVALVAQPFRFTAPIDVLLGLIDVLAPKAEAEGLEAHRLHADVGGKDHEVGPRERAAILGLDGPEQAARLVEVAVVGPAVERREALRARRRTAAAIGGAVRAGAVPRHADEERTVVTVVGRPPILGARHELDEIRAQRLDVELLERVAVV